MPDETAATDGTTRALFVGRQREMETLWAALEGALAGRGGMVMLVGEPGHRQDPHGPAVCCACSAAGGTGVLGALL